MNKGPLASSYHNKSLPQPLPLLRLFRLSKHGRLAFPSPPSPPQIPWQRPRREESLPPLIAIQERPLCMPIDRHNWWRLQAAPSNQRAVKSCRVGNRLKKARRRRRRWRLRSPSLKGRSEEGADAWLQETNFVSWHLWLSCLLKSVLKKSFVLIFVTSVGWHHQKIQNQDK